MKRTYLDDLNKYTNIKYNEGEIKNIIETMTEEEIRNLAKEYYEDNLPVDLLTWSRVNVPSDDMLFKDHYWKQIMVVRDHIPYLLIDNYEQFKVLTVNVIGTHKSKSILLPVYEINLPHVGIKIIMRNDFFDWKVSVISEKDIELKKCDLFKDKEISPVYCEGFKKEHVFGPYSKNKKQFTIEIDDTYKLVTFLYIICKYDK